MSFVRNRNKTGLDPLTDETPGHTLAKNGWATEIRNAEYVGDILENRLTASPFAVIQSLVPLIHII